MAVQADEIRHPEHYTWRGTECKEIISELTYGADGAEAMYSRNIIKYLYRYPKKGTPVKDLQKARQYLDFLIVERTEREKEREADK